MPLLLPLNIPTTSTSTTQYDALHYAVLPHRTVPLLTAKVLELR